MSKKSRNGIRKLGRSLNRRCDHYATKMLGGARRPNYLAIACRALTEYLRIAKRMAKRDPHLFGPRAREYYLDTLRLERQEQECQVALDEVYGPPSPDQPKLSSTVRTDRYYFSDPQQRLQFLKWFHKNYPS